jgi:phosphate transport system protein
MSAPEGKSLRTEFHDQLHQLEATVQEEGQLVLRALRGALNTLTQRDPELADEVITFDDEVDSRAASVESQVEAILATQAPVASELRLVLAILHVNIHLERMADLSVNIAKVAKLGHSIQPDAPVVIEGFEEMGSRAEEMTKIAMDSFANRDAAAALTLPQLDELIDNSNRRMVRHLAQLETDEASREWALLMIVVSRCLERIGDNAVDIGEQTNYLVTGEFREFEDASHPVSRP